MREADALPRHLRHAEEWLRRARRDYRRGDHHGAVLRLMLAEAEVQRARETGLRLVTDPPAPRARRFSVAAGALGAAAAIVVGVYAALWAAGGMAPMRPSAAQVRPISSADDVVRLDAGGFLTLTPLAPRDAPSAGAAARTFGDRVVEEVVLHSRWLAPASGGAVTPASPLDAGRPDGAF